MAVVPRYEGWFIDDPSEDLLVELLVVERPVDGPEGPWRIDGVLVRVPEKGPEWVEGRRDDSWDTDPVTLWEYFVDRGGNGQTWDVGFIRTERLEDVPAVIEHVEEELAGGRHAPASADEQAVDSVQITAPIQIPHRDTRGEPVKADETAADVEAEELHPDYRLTMMLLAWPPDDPWTGSMIHHFENGSFSSYTDVLDMVDRWTRLAHAGELPSATGDHPSNLVGLISARDDGGGVGDGRLLVAYTPRIFEDEYGLETSETRSDVERHLAEFERTGRIPVRHYENPLWSTTTGAGNKLASYAGLPLPEWPGDL